MALAGFLVGPVALAILRVLSRSKLRTLCFDLRPAGVSGRALAFSDDCEKPHRVSFSWLVASALTLLLLAPPASAQLVTLSIETHLTPPTEYEPPRDAVIFIVNAWQPISGFNLRLIDEGVTLHRDEPPWLDIWTLNDWHGQISADKRAFHAEFIPTEYPVPITSYFGFVFGPDPVLKQALLQAEVSYEIGGVEHAFSAVPETGLWSALAVVVLGLAMCRRLFSRAARRVAA